jgi:hypothetical protein
MENRPQPGDPLPICRVNLVVRIWSDLNEPLKELTVVSIVAEKT